MQKIKYIAVIGEAQFSSPENAEIAYNVGKLIALRKAIVVCGGLSGVMFEACRGAKEAGGTTIGILPGFDKNDANQYVDYAIPTGLGDARNAVIIRTADAAIAIGGSYGTLSEIAYAMKKEIPVAAISSWEFERKGQDSERYYKAISPIEAVEHVFKMIL